MGILWKSGKKINDKAKMQAGVLDNASVHPTESPSVLHRKDGAVDKQRGRPLERRQHSVDYDPAVINVIARDVSAPERREWRRLGMGTIQEQRKDIARVAPGMTRAAQFVHRRTTSASQADLTDKPWDLLQNEDALGQYRKEKAFHVGRWLQDIPVDLIPLSDSDLASGIERSLSMERPWASDLTAEASSQPRTTRAASADRQRPTRSMPHISSQLRARPAFNSPNSSRDERPLPHSSAIHQVLRSSPGGKLPPAPPLAAALFENSNGTAVMPQLLDKKADVPGSNSVPPPAPPATGSRVHSTSGGQATGEQPPVPRESTPPPARRTRMHVRSFSMDTSEMTQNGQFNDAVMGGNGVQRKPRQNGHLLQHSEAKATKLEDYTSDSNHERLHIPIPTHGRSNSQVSSSGSLGSADSERPELMHESRGRGHVRRGDPEGVLPRNMPRNRGEHSPLQPAAEREPQRLQSSSNAREMALVDALGDAEWAREHLSAGLGTTQQASDSRQHAGQPWQNGHSPQTPPGAVQGSKAAHTGSVRDPQGNTPTCLDSAVDESSQGSSQDVFPLPQPPPKKVSARKHRRFLSMEMDSIPHAMGALLSFTGTNKSSSPGSSSRSGNQEMGLGCFPSVGSKRVKQRGVDSNSSNGTANRGRERSRSATPPLRSGRKPRSPDPRQRKPLAGEDAQPACSQQAEVSVRAPASKPQESGTILGRPLGDIRNTYLLSTEELGRGRFGVIYVCTHRRTGARLACKSISKDKLKCVQDVEDVRREVAVMECLRGHPSIILLHEAFEDSQSVHLVMELCEGGELFDRIKLRKRYSEAGAAIICRTMLEVLRYCHSKGVMHRDLKPENILLCTHTDDTTVKIIDYGVAAYFRAGHPLTDVAGSPYYLAPEVLGGRYGPEADVWSAGVVLYILLCGLPPFWATSEAGIFAAIKEGRLNLTGGVWPTISAEAKDLVRGMLHMDPQRRLTPDDILRHEWLNQQTGGDKSAS